MRNKVKNRKKLFAAVASVILGESKQVRISGDVIKRDALQEAVASTKVLYDALNKSDTGLDSVVSMIEQKRRSAQRFERAFGFPWIL